MAALPALRPYQAAIIADLRQAYRRGARAPLLALPTGGGKTHIFAHAAAMAQAKGRSVLILVHRRELLAQASEKLTAAGVPHGIIAPGHATTRNRVQVASVQTLARRLDQDREAPHLVIIDEAHHAVAGQWRTILEQFPGAWLLGVTATPCRLDGAGLGVSAGGVFDALVTGPSAPDLTAEGFLVPARIFAPEIPPDLRGILHRPTKSVALYLQQVGRGLRPAPGKKELIVLDHAGNSIVHGLPGAPRRWTLDGAGSGGTPNARRMAAFCPGCASIVRRARPTCRSCGASLGESQAPVSLPGVSLREVGGTADARRQGLLSRPVAELVLEAQAIDDLVSIQRAQGFKPGWVWHQWRAITAHRSPAARASRSPRRQRR